MECELAGKTEVLEENSGQCHFFHHKNLHYLNWTRINWLKVPKSLISCFINHRFGGKLQNYIHDENLRNITSFLWDAQTVEFNVVETSVRLSYPQIKGIYNGLRRLNCTADITNRMTLIFWQRHLHGTVDTLIITLVVKRIPVPRETRISVTRAGTLDLRCLQRT
jgi:hypothetical protein